MSAQLTISIPDAVYDRLRKHSSVLGKKPEDVAADLLGAAPVLAEEVPILQWIGAFESDVPDAAERVDHYLGQAFLEESKASPEK